MAADRCNRVVVWFLQGPFFLSGSEICCRNSKVRNIWSFYKGLKLYKAGGFRYIYPVNSINGYYPNHINLPLKASGLRCSKKHASITVAAWVASKYFRTVPANDANMLSHLPSCCVLNQPSDDMTKSTSNQQYSENQECYPWNPLNSVNATNATTG